MNLEYLQRLCSDDPSRMAEFVSLYLHEAPGQFAAMHALALASEAAKLAFAAHALQPQALCMGDHRFCDRLADVEQRAKANNMAGCAEAAHACLVRNEELMAELRTWMATAPMERNR